jgi:Ser/Thr protein kinase RdoA (MazF antagonist)
VTRPLALRDVVPYLVGAGVVTPADVVDGDLTVEAHRRRNRSFSVRWRGDRGVFLKQLLEVAEGGRSELRLYQLAAAHPHPALRALPRPVYLDAARDIVAIELLHPAVPLWERVEGTDARVFHGLGRSIASLHVLLARPEGPGQSIEHGFPHIQVWAFGMAELTVDMLFELSPANVALHDILRRQVPPALFESARRAWSPSTLIHDDFKCDNVLVTGDVPRIVDWEFAGWGDPAWDVGTMLQSIACVWLQAEAVGRPSSLSSVVRSRCAAFWSGYVEGAGLDESARRELAARSALMSAMRLLQSAYEEGHRRTVLQRIAVLAVQVAVNIGRDPARAARELYGLV